MKGMDIFCGSPASTAICSSTEHRSMVRHGHHRRIERSKSYAACSASQLMRMPYYEKGRKSSCVKPSDVRRKSSADVHDLNTSSSSRYLLSDKAPFIDWLSESDRASALVPELPLPPPDTKAKDITSTSNHSLALKSSSSADQVVVLKVSIHCKGCEGKIRKHISKMEGVTSFSIDLATKKVTVIGDVTPSSVLASVSRVKNAQLWPSTTPSHLPQRPKLLIQEK